MTRQSITTNDPQELNTMLECDPLELEFVAKNNFFEKGGFEPGTAELEELSFT